jgi:phospholipid/cholesterol/gamma-HCH transport system substrate-binding protein
VRSAETGVGALDSGLTKTQNFLASLGSDKNGGELLPTVISIRELAENFNKRSGALMSDGRRMLGDLSQSFTKAGRKLGDR